MILRLLGAALLLIAAASIPLAQPKNGVFGEFAKTKPVVGDAAPRMHLKDTDGKEMDLREYLGSWVVIEFGSYT